MSRVQRTRQRRLKNRRRVTAAALGVVAFALAAGAVLQVMDGLGPVSLGAKIPAANPAATAAPAAAPAIEESPADTTFLPLRSIHALMQRRNFSLEPAARIAQPVSAVVSPLLPVLLVQDNAPQAMDRVEPTATPAPTTAPTVFFVNPQNSPAATEPENAATPAPTASPEVFFYGPEGGPALPPPQPAPTEAASTDPPAVVTTYRLMPADFLNDNLTGKDASALQRVLRSWGFSDEDGTGAWQAEDGYHLSLFQRWAGLKPTGTVDGATRQSLLDTWNRYADRAIPRQKLPLEGRYIGLNPGHQNRNFDKSIGPDNDERFWDVTIGTRGRATGVYEYQLNLTVALKARDALQALGARVLLSRTGNDVRVSNTSRTRKLNKEQVDAVLLIHADGNVSGAIHGLHMIVSTPGARQTGAVHRRSTALAQSMQSACIAATGAADRGVGERDDLRILLSSCAMPAALIEMGYMTNRAEDVLLNTPEYQDKIVSGITQGFVDYFQNQP